MDLDCLFAVKKLSRSGVSCLSKMVINLSSSTSVAKSVPNSEINKQEEMKDSLPEISKNLLPTPSKFHYIFNLRDISRIYEGLCLANPDHFERSEQIVRLWRNESLRVFHDRLVNESDKDYVSKLINRIVIDNFEPSEVYVTKNPILFTGYNRRDVKLPM